MAFKPGDEWPPGATRRLFITCLTWPWVKSDMWRPETPDFSPGSGFIF